MPVNGALETNRFRCNACGRWLNAARADRDKQDSTPHQRNEHDSTTHPLQHGAGETRG